MSVFLSSSSVSTASTSAHHHNQQRQQWNNKVPSTVSSVSTLPNQSGSSHCSSQSHPHHHTQSTVHLHQGNHMHNKVPPHKSFLPSFFPFTLLSETFLLEVNRTVVHPEARNISLLLIGNLFWIALVTYWGGVTNSLALSAYKSLSWFHVLSLLTCYVTLYVRLRGVTTKEWSEDCTMGAARLEVLAVFASSVLSMLGALFIIKEALERSMGNEEVHTGCLMIGAIACLLSQLATTYLAPNTALAHVTQVSPSSWLQEHASDSAASLCGVFPPLSAYLLPRINPLALLSVIGFALIFLLDVIIEINNAHITDAIVSLFFGLALLGTMYPLMTYTGRILLQSAPTHVVPQLDRRLREALTIDGVLEFKDEHFWTVSFGKLAGSLTVRVRRDADEQLVLAHLTSRLADLVWPLTIQISKDLPMHERQGAPMLHPQRQHLNHLMNAGKSMPNLTPRAGSNGAAATVSPQGISPVNRTTALLTATTPNNATNGSEFRTSTPKDGDSIDGSSNGHVDVASPISAYDQNNYNGFAASRFLAPPKPMPSFKGTSNLAAYANNGNNGFGQFKNK